MVAAAKATNGKIYAMGGTADGGATTLTTVEEYDPATDTWPNCGGACTPMPVARRAFALVAHNNGKLYTIAGCNSANCLAGEHPTAVHEFNPATNTWTNCGGTCAVIPTARSYVGGALGQNAKIYIFGGSVNGSVYATVNEYDVIGNSWSNCGGSCPTLPGGARWSLRSGTLTSGTILVVGGMNTGGTEQVTVEEFNPGSSTWTNCGGTCASLPSARSQFGMAVSAADKAYVAGNAISSTSVLEFTYGGSWASVANLPTGVAQPDCTLAGNGRIYCLAGTLN